MKLRRINYELKESVMEGIDCVFDLLDNLLTIIIAILLFAFTIYGFMKRRKRMKDHVD